MHEVREWKHPKNYAGVTWEGWFSAGFGQSRDSDCLEESNFQAASDTLLPLAGKDESTVQVVRENHWAVGWVEWIAVHNTNKAALDKARELCAQANDYPVLDEEDFSRREDEECEQIWHDCFSASERLDYLRTHSYTANTCADLLQAIRAGSWYHAANMLHCPSDLLG